MTLQQQRFCPLCDRAFLEGEAVLRCEGCGVMHHPGCWVTNGGCGTRTQHASTPLAQAYSIGRSAGEEAPHPGEGLRVTTAARGIYPTDPLPAPPRAEPPVPPFGAPGRRPLVGVDDEGWPVIGGAGAPPAAHRARAEYLAGQPLGAPAGTQIPQRRYVPPPYEANNGPRPLPRVYGRHRLLGYWYVPAGLLLAAVVASGVISLVGLFTGGGSTSAPTATVGPTLAAVASGTTPVPGGATSAPGTSTPVGSPQATTGAGKFTAGETLTVTGTAPDCLNIRSDASTTNPPIICLKDGVAVTVTGGPEAAGGLTWWKVNTSAGEGWAAQDYLAGQ